MKVSINRMDLVEFMSEGYLMEVNRQFFHPLGMSLVVVGDSSSDAYTLTIDDYREDPEGGYFGDFNLEDAEHAANVLKIILGRQPIRIEKLGWWIEPMPTEDDFDDDFDGYSR